MAAELITIKEYCFYHHTDVSFIDALEQSGLIRVVQAEQDRCIEYAELSRLESFTRWYHELDLTVEGIEVVQHLLKKLDTLQEHIRQLEERLNRYE